MTDRELLELAAKAIGIELIEWPNGSFIQKDNTTDFARTVNNAHNGGFPERFDPLTYDHQAFRLAVNLGLLVGAHDDESWAQWYIKPDGGWLTFMEAHGEDPYAATRRAIVRAAAEIGRGMP